MDFLRAVILDFDGIILESNEAKTEAFAELFSLYPIYCNQMMDFHLTNISMPRRIKFEYFVYTLMNKPGDVALVDKMASRFSEIVFRRVMNCSEVPGARAFLEAFHGRLPLYVSSMTPQDELIEIMRRRGFAEYFVDIFGDPPIKKTEAIRKIIQKEAITPGQAVFVGDSDSDFRAAKLSGIPFIGRNSGQAYQCQGVYSCRDLFDVAAVLSHRFESHATK